MSRYSGRVGPGARARRHAQAKAEAAERNARTPTERTAWFRRQRAKVQAKLAELSGARGPS